MAEKKAKPKEFDAQAAIEQAVKEQPSANYAVELLLSAKDAEPFEYLSLWDVKGKKYRVVALLNKDNKILVQAKFVPNA